MARNEEAVKQSKTLLVIRDFVNLDKIIATNKEYTYFKKKNLAGNCRLTDDRG